MNKKVSKSLCVFSLVLVSTGAIAVQPASEEGRYSTCIDLASRSPDKAINMALVWQNDQGGVPARHCEALGLFHMQEYGEAAARLQKIAEDMRVGRDMPVRRGKRLVAAAPMLADMYGQAANAWLLAGEIIRAESAIDAALSLAVAGSTQEGELLIDRARIAAADQDYGLALQDLERVQKQDPGRKDILVLIASAARGLGRLVKAEVAIKDYMAVFPDSVDGHLEQGNLYDAQGQTANARRSWLKVLELTDEVGPEADAARANLERVDVAAQE